MLPIKIVPQDVLGPALKGRVLQEADQDHVEAAAGDLLVVKPFGEPTYATLTPLGSVVNSEDRPFHAVINGENLLLEKA